MPGEGSLAVVVLCACVLLLSGKPYVMPPKRAQEALVLGACSPWQIEPPLRSSIVVMAQEISLSFVRKILLARQLRIKSFSRA